MFICYFTIDELLTEGNWLQIGLTKPSKLAIDTCKLWWIKQYLSNTIASYKSWHKFYVEEINSQCRYHFCIRKGVPFVDCNGFNPYLLTHVATHRTVSITHITNFGIDRFHAWYIGLDLITTNSAFIPVR